MELNLDPKESMSIIPEIPKQEPRNYASHVAMQVALVDQDPTSVPEYESRIRLGEEGAIRSQIAMEMDQRMQAIKNEFIDESMQEADIETTKALVNMSDVQTNPDTVIEQQAAIEGSILQDEDPRQFTHTYLAPEQVAQREQDNAKALILNNALQKVLARVQETTTGEMVGDVAELLIPLVYNVKQANSLYDLFLPGQQAAETAQGIWDEQDLKKFQMKVNEMIAEFTLNFENNPVATLSAVIDHLYAGQTDNETAMRITRLQELRGEDGNMMPSLLAEIWSEDSIIDQAFANEYFLTAIDNPITDLGLWGVGATGTVKLLYKVAGKKAAARAIVEAGQATERVPAHALNTQNLPAENLETGLAVTSEVADMQDQLNNVAHAGLSSRIQDPAIPPSPEQWESTVKSLAPTYGHQGFAGAVWQDGKALVHLGTKKGTGFASERSAKAAIKRYGLDDDQVQVIK